MGDAARGALGDATASGALGDATDGGALGDATDGGALRACSLSMDAKKGVYKEIASFSEVKWP